MKKAQVIAAVSEAKLQLAWAKNHPDEAMVMIAIADKCLNLALKMLTEQPGGRGKREGKKTTQGIDSREQVQPS